MMRFKHVHWTVKAKRFALDWAPSRHLLAVLFLFSLSTLQDLVTEVQDLETELQVLTVDPMEVPRLPLVRMTVDLLLVPRLEALEEEAMLPTRAASSIPSLSRGQVQVSKELV